jgi:hypothetical protein
MLRYTYSLILVAMWLDMCLLVRTLSSRWSLMHINAHGCGVVDGAAWRMPSASIGASLKYPDFLLSGNTVANVKGQKKSKL